MRESIVFSEPVKRPTSVLELTSGSRADKSPSAIAAAVSSIWLSGLRVNLIRDLATIPIEIKTIMLISINIPVSPATVFSTLSKATEITTVPSPDGRALAIARISGSPSAPGIVKGRPPSEITFAGVKL